MKLDLDTIVAKAIAERRRQFDLPGSEWDALNRPGEWIALITRYVSNEVKRNGVTPSSEDFQDTMIKAIAVIFAALEHIDTMRERNELQ